MYLRLHLGRKAIWIILIVLALMAVYPVIFLSVGSLMGADELEDSLGAVVSGTEGYVIFCHVLEFYPDYVRSSWGAVCSRDYGGMGICKI